jgi:translation initiation factor IF-2
MSKRIHELAKEWGQSPKDVLACAERLGMEGKRSQSSFTDEEAQRVREALGLVPRGDGLAIGKERVVAERVVTSVEQGAENLVTSREKTTETRLGSNVIRRRTARQVLRREQAPPSVADADLEPSDVPPSLVMDSDIPPPAPEPIPPAMPPEIPPAMPDAELAAPPEVAVASPPVAPPSGAPEVRARPAEAVPVVSRAAQDAPRVERARVVERGPVPARPIGPLVRRPNAPAPLPAFEDQRGPRVLGRIDLRKATPPPPAGNAVRPAPAPGGAATPGAPGAPAAPDAAGAAARRKKGRRVVKKAELTELMERDRARAGKRPQKRRALPGKEQRKTEVTTPRASKRVIRISEVITVGELARAMGVKAGEVLKKLIDMGMMATINQALDFDTTALVAGEFEYNVENVAFDVEQALEAEQTAAPGEMTTRAPVVTMMGHVDHGKTSLLDAIRKTNVAAREAGGITQHIGAYTVDVSGRRVTFLDTPGHEAFTAMRARGAQATDIVVLVVAADDGVMPQTIEAINHARAASVPILVAVNKIDKPEANLERTRQALSQHGLAPEDWGGDTIVAGVSARTGEGIEHLLEMILLQADVLELRANPARLAKGIIVEARLDRGRGPVATVLVQEGTLKVGDSFVCGTEYGRIRAMMDDKGRRVTEAGPSTPVEIQGLGGVPGAGDVLVAVTDEQKARQVAEHRHGKQRDADMSKTAKVSLDELYQQIQTGEVKELKVVLKADVQGSLEAVGEALRKLATSDVRLSVIHGSVGGITESDVLLASASNAIIIGFNVRPEPKAAALAEREGVDIRPYTIIYEALAEVRDALEGLLEPTTREQVLGRAEVRQTFTVSGIGTIAGCFVTDGKIVRTASVRLLRDNVVVQQGKISSLKRFKDDAREVLAGYECGIGIENYQDVKVGDVIEAYVVEQVARRLGTGAGTGRGAQAADRPA